jgi:hypothetical protein
VAFFFFFFSSFFLEKVYCRLRRESPHRNRAMLDGMRSVARAPHRAKKLQFMFTAWPALERSDAHVQS